MRVNRRLSKNVALGAALLAAILLFVFAVAPVETAPSEIAFSEFLTRVEDGRVEEVTIEEGEIHGRLADGGEFATYAPVITEALIADLYDRGVAIRAQPRDEESSWKQILLAWLPILLFVGIFIFFVRRMQAGGGPAMSFGKSKAHLLGENQPKITFEDVAGVEESKAELEEIIEFLREPEKFTRLGGRIPKGVLLVGPPGTGKTLLARAVAGEASVPFYAISGSDFVELFVGVGASRVRDLFRQAKANAPCIVFIDEIDAVGRHRGAGIGGGHDEREQTLNQLLAEMDGFESNEDVILIAATNRPDVLDPALLRPGRFDRRVVVPRPDLRGRRAILAVHARRVPLAEDVDLELQARGTPGFAGADLENLVNEAALLAARRDATRVGPEDFEAAKDKVVLGAERRSLILSDQDKRIAAYHEGGHALVSLLTPEDSDPVHKVTILPRGTALGTTQTLPSEERLRTTRDQIRAIIRRALGGRAAEELAFGHLSTRAAKDLEQATDWGRRMICQYGMSEKLGPVWYGSEREEVFLGRDFLARREYSESKSQEIDEELSRILGESYDEAKRLLRDHRAILDRIAEALLERETLDAADLALLVAGQPLLPLPFPIGAEEGASARPSRPKGAKGSPGRMIPVPEPVSS
jgi:cell division protease FtsH